MSHAADRVLHVPPGVDLQQLKDFVDGRGPVPDRASLEDFEAYAARGRLADCDCQLIQCVCEQARRHAKGCRFRTALTCAVPIDCAEHGRDVCATCDPCDCGARARALIEMGEGPG